MEEGKLCTIMNCTGYTNTLDNLAEYLEKGIVK